MERNLIREHKEFESTMIACVNRNANNADETRREAYLAAREKENRNRRRKKSDAAGHIMAWISVYLAVSVCMVYLAWLELIPGGFSTIICSVTSLVVGFKLSALFRAFRK